MASAKSKFTKYVGQTLVSTGVIFYYVDPADKNEYKAVECVYMPVYPPSAEPRTP